MSAIPRDTRDYTSPSILDQSLRLSWANLEIAAFILLMALSIFAHLWQLDVKGSSPKLMCVTDQIRLVQIEHDQPGCSRFVIANEPKSSTVHYSCQRAGWGRTTVRVQSPTLATIQTQGIAHNEPFDYSAQAHRVGVCTAQTAAK